MTKSTDRYIGIQTHLLNLDCDRLKQICRLMAYYSFNKKSRKNKPMIHIANYVKQIGGIGQIRIYRNDLQRIINTRLRNIQGNQIRSGN